MTNGISALCGPTSATIFLREAQSSVFVDDGKEISDTDHLHAEGGTEAFDDVSSLDPVDEAEDHGEADT